VGSEGGGRPAPSPFGAHAPQALDLSVGTVPGAVGSWIVRQENGNNPRGCESGLFTLRFSLIQCITLL